MMLGILTLITALTISAVAIYYSVAGLVAIFAAAALPIMIMGGALEIGKLVTAVWLHRYWTQATWWLKTYLTASVVLLMFITSMGIFGFLSKAHIEQTSASDESIARIETLQSEIDRNLAIISRAEDKIKQIENSGTGADQTIQSQIDKEQERIDTAYDRVQPLIDEQKQFLEEQIKLFGLDRVDEKIAELAQMSAINTRDRDAVKLLQALVGAKPDGAYGSGTAGKVDQYRQALNDERQRVLDQIQSARTATNEEIARIRAGVDKQIAESNKLINRLREKLNTASNSDDIDRLIDEQNERVRLASSEIDNLTDERIQIEAEYRKLEAEVGPIKYIAEFIYGDTADKSMLEEAVRWVIILIIFVFDPLAVLLLIASQYTFEFSRKRKEDYKQYEHARAQRIVDNPGYNTEGNDVTTKEESTQDTIKAGVGNRSTVGKNTGDTQSVPMEQEEDTKPTKETVNGEFSAGTSGTKDNGRNTASRVVVAERVNEYEEFDNHQDFESDGLDRTSDTEKLRASSSDLVEDEEQYIDEDQIGQETDEQRERREIYEELDEHETIKDLKQQWKAENPNENLKTYKKLYIQGKIDNLPWLESYEQNSEQSENSLWNKIQQNR